MNRISTQQFTQSGINTIHKNQLHLNNLIEQISSGKRNDLDPIEKVQQLSYSVSISNKAQQIRNGDTVMPTLDAQESALSSITDRLMSLQETMIAAQNPATRMEPSFKETVSAIKKDILSVINTQDAEGNYIFAGYRSQTKPFPDLTTYNGDQGVREIRIGDNTKINVNITGEKVITSNITDAFNKIENLLNNGVEDQTMLDSVQKAMEDVSLQRTIVGTNKNRIEDAQNFNRDISIEYQSRLSQVKDTDMLKTVSELSATQTITQASLKSYSMIQNLSLFNYL
jgi:flagellar hook-associated protein 3 FlgL